MIVKGKSKKWVEERDTGVRGMEGGEMKVMDQGGGAKSDGKSNEKFTMDRKFISH